MCSEFVFTTYSLDCLLKTKSTGMFIRLRILFCHIPSVMSHHQFYWYVCKIKDTGHIPTPSVMNQYHFLMVCVCEIKDTVTFLV